ncbi:MAG: Zn-dependent hydrolase [Deltaproteobacteria bacterium]|nr:Zn-dependent hydrolase [Deltaproteobacteria bacterium]MBW2386512.1 Zn-dependent hydrolase [Deltaproteobacteria bacterium]MBW2695080.1 Zn-dependent hydrolase [Deltaproteobacteria bacterium]
MVKIDPSRLWKSIMETARIGETPRGGLCRLALSDEDLEVRDWLTRACEQLGCSLAVDDMGNMFATRAGWRHDADPICVGSHLDTQPTGGRFDGILGVLAGLEILRSLDDHGVETEHPIQLINWTNEEGARFAPAMMGSGVFARAVDKGAVLASRDRDGVRLGDELTRIGYRGEEPCGRHALDSYFELHIEQGPVLESEGKVIGIVEGAQGMRWYDLTVCGSAAHAGTTPMQLRRDALVGAARIVCDLNELAEEMGGGALATNGVLESTPGSRNVVPDRAFLTIDLRNPDDGVLDVMEERLDRIVSDRCSNEGLEFQLERIWSSPPVRFDSDCVAAVREAARRSGQPTREILSGAGHDAVYISRIVPTAMIFIPCEGGLSHNEQENAEQEHVAAGASVLLDAILERDRAR